MTNAEHTNFKNKIELELTTEDLHVLKSMIEVELMERDLRTGRAFEQWLAGHGKVEDLDKLATI